LWTSTSSRRAMPLSVLTTRIMSNSSTQRCQKKNSYVRVFAEGRKCMSRWIPNRGSLSLGFSMRNSNTRGHSHISTSSPFPARTSKRRRSNRAIISACQRSRSSLMKNKAKSSIIARTPYQRIINSLLRKFSSRRSVWTRSSTQRSPTAKSPTPLDNPTIWRVMENLTSLHLFGQAVPIKRNHIQIP
jgi:hypothetical protein